MKVIVKYLIFISMLPVIGHGQVYLSGLSSNPVIESYLKYSDKVPQTKSGKANGEALRLPFIDDFSNEGPYPDATKWLDSAVYINAHYPIFPVNYGAATFDVLDATGNIYSGANVFPFIADYLTSYPIRLDSIFDLIQDTSWKTTPADSIYFSFYYQPQGRGDAPLGYDSLSLEFGTTDSVFSEIGKIWIQISNATNSNGIPFVNGDTIKPNDSVFYSGCQNFNYFVAPDTLFYSDSVYVACDSLFKPQTTWSIVWNAEGEELDSFLIKNNVYFKMVMIPVTNTRWFRENFQFRFYNYGSLSSINSWKTNTDHWCIDKVYLNAGRSQNDIFTREIKFVEQAPSLIKTYSSMPRYHFSPDMLKESIIAYANNNDSIPHECTYTFSVQDEDGNYVPGLIGGYSGLMDPYYLQEVNTYQPFAEAPVENELNPQPGPKEIIFTVNHYIKDNEDPSVTDTIYHQQVFSNYFAYDDGSAERSYGASADNVKIAVQFRSFEPDTLRGVQIYFNRIQDEDYYRYFHLGVWNDNNGKPGSLIFEKENLKAVPDDLDSFHTYTFGDTIYGDTIIRLGVYNYYVGVTQTTFDNLNIGFDRNNDSGSKTFYNTSATWIESPFEGSLMIRPVLGRTLIGPQPKPKSEPVNLEIFPNPPVNSVQINLILPSTASSPDYRKYLTTRIYDLSGRLLFSAPFEDQLNIAGLEAGFYIVDILDEAFTKHYTAKLLITK
jgi:hypothetical protein